MNPTIRSTLFIFFTMFSLYGCSLYRQQKVTPPLPIPDSYKERASVFEKSIAHMDRWWEVFEDKRLNRLMEDAFKNNLDLMMAFERLKEAEAVTRIDLASERPIINFDGVFSRNREPGTFGATTGNNYSLSIAADYEVDLWNRLASLTQASRLEYKATLEDIKALYISISAQLADLYFLAQEERAQIELTDRIIESFKETLDRVELRYKAGLVPALDLYQARQSLASAMANRSIHESNLAEAEHAIAIIRGRYPERMEIDAGDLSLEVPGPFATGLPSELLTKRPDINRELLRLKASDARLAAAIADRFPSFDIATTIGRSGTALSTGDISGLFWKVLVEVAAPVFDGGRRDAEVDRSKAIFRESLAAYYRTVLNAFKEVEDALVRNRTTEERITRLEEQVEASREALRLSKDRYLHGLSDYLPVLTAQTLYFQAESELIAAKRQLISDRISLARALGGKWMDVEIKKRVLDTEER